MTEVAFGTAQLFGVASAGQSVELLQEARRCGIRRFDTAPAYGAGRSERCLGELIAGSNRAEFVTTKVGLKPLKLSLSKRRAMGKIARAVLPMSLVQRLRHKMHARTFGHFEMHEVLASIESSLRRLNGRIDRLLLHEVTPEDITDDLLELLGRFRANGDVAELGVATRNELTADCMSKGEQFFAVAQIAVGPLDSRVPEISHVTTRVGHGLLGGGGAHCGILQHTLNHDPQLLEEWRDVTAGTMWEGPGGVARALLARGSGNIDVTELIVSTTKVDRVASCHELTRGAHPLPSELGHLVERVIRTAQLEQARSGSPER